MWCQVLASSAKAPLSREYAELLLVLVLFSLRNSDTHSMLMLSVLYSTVCSNVAMWCAKIAAPIASS